MTWQIHNVDCFEFMQSLPEGSVGAVVTDPPYGIGFASMPTKWQRRSGMKPREWDKSAPDVSAILSMRVPTAIWGGNYFVLPPSRGWLAWTKPDAPPSMGNVELAWTNVNRTAKSISHSISATNKERVGHPTQKPVAVMMWTIKTMGIPEGSTIFDPFVGSGTTGVASIRLGYNFIGCEIDAGYCEIARRRCKEAEESIGVFQ